MWGIIPAAGSGTRIQPLAFSKELLPVGSRIDPTGVERPRAVSEYLVDRMARSGVQKLCFVISAAKLDIMQYYGGSYGSLSIAYVVQGEPEGLCDAVFHAAPLVAPDEAVVIGLPDTVWFPENALSALPRDVLSLLLFPVERPSLFDSVEADATGRVRRIAVKSPDPPSRWIWGAMQMPGRTFHALHVLWQRRDRTDEYLGTLLNAWIGQSEPVHGIAAGTSYVDVGTLHGYRLAMHLLEGVDLVQPQPADTTRNRENRA
jgi:glucose-1-phosphate thymidylyltransferase